MSTGMLSLDTCPRDMAGLMSVPRGVRYRLAYQLGMFADDSQEQAFNGATDEQQIEALAAGLAQRDAQKGTPQQQVLPMEQQPQMPFPPPQFAMQPPGMAPQMQMPQQMQQMQPMQQQQQQMQTMAQPSMGQPVMPPQPPQQLQQVQPPQQPMRQPPQMGMPPQLQPPTMPGMQPMAPQPQMYAPQPPMQQQQPQAAPAPQQPVRQPPGDAGQSAALPVMRTMSEALKKVAEVNEANQKWLQQLHDQGHNHTKLLEVLVRLLLAKYAQEGMDVGLLTKLVAQVSNDDITCVLGVVDGKGKG